MKRASVAVLVLLSLSFAAPMIAQAAVVSSTTQALVTSTTAQSVTFKQPHVSQPVGNYKFWPSGAVNSFNNNENLSLSPALKVGATTVSFLSYAYNSTLFQYSATVLGCSITVQYLQAGFNLKQNIVGSGCPLAQYKFSLSSSKGTVGVYNATTKTITFNGIEYSWANDVITGATISYSAGVVTFTTTASSFSIDPTLVQSGTSADCGAATTCALAFGSNVGAGHIIVVAAGWVVNSASGYTMTTADTLGLTYTSSVTVNPQTAGQSSRSEIFYSTTTTAGADTVTVTLSHAAGDFEIQIFEVSGITTTGVTTGTGSCTASCSTALSTSAVSFSSGAFLIAKEECLDGCTSMTAGTGFTKLGDYYLAAEYAVSGISSPTTFPFTAGGTPTKVWSEVGAQFPGLVNAVFVLQVDTASHGAIFMPTINNAPTTISSSTTITATCCSTTTLTVIAQGFASYIWGGWSGATTWIQDTVNPTQTVTYSSFATTTLSSTLTALFPLPVTTVSYLSTACAAGSAVNGITTVNINCSAVSASSANSSSFLWVLILPLVLLAIVLSIRKRRFR